MLTQETKRKIDSARQILVGKVPDPKAQVEQITTALIYKFMDDMDKEAQELGGKVRFFANGYEKYAWTKLMDTKLGGQDRLNLYVEAITTLSQNPHLPQLFRDIFKDAFLPYRDPETLNLFLKEINGFTYEHSEDLGDAYEYLLSILGSQGDAGQFRTPRHIIDFIVAAVDPKKDETICDPACGTAGFLISAFKHILKENKEKSLTPDERKNLMDHFVGYDISPDMVRISKVNLYLHGFPNPTIFEYDTLSSEEKWDENFDVMLANPPFMSPRGGIRPHKRFSVQANRSEVLFVDYILEHLRTNGRAGIIVPEGIIFQSAKAYKALRKLLIEDGLLAVVSLPAGVFNPYAGVKTSILLFDNGLAKKTKDILFLKIQNDGYDLGAQRRKIDKNDLPQALEIIKKYKTALKENKKFKLNEEQAKIAHLVAKEKIAETGEYNLSGDRYIETVNFANIKFPVVEIKDFIDITTGRINANQAKENGKYPFYTCGQEILKIDKTAFEGESILLAGNGDFGLKYHTDGPFNAYQRTYVIKSKNQEKLLNKYLFYAFKEPIKKILSQGGVIQYLRLPQITGIKIPFPPIEVQKEIIEQIEVKQKAISAAKAVIENLEREKRYFGQEIRKIKDVEWVKLGEICEITSSKRVFQSEWKKEGVPFYRAREIVKLSENGFVDNELFITEEMFRDYSAKYGAPREGDLMITGVGTLGICYRVRKNDRFYFKDGNIIWLKNFNKKVDSKYINLLFSTDLIANQIKSFAQGGTVGTYTIINAKNTEIPLPPLETQKQLVAEMEKQEKIIEANKKLIEMMEQKIAEVLSEI